MESPTNLLEFVVWDRLPFAISVILIAFIGGRLAARSLDSLGEKISQNASVIFQGPDNYMLFKTNYIYHK